jgi:predicted phosphodiesterase
MRNNRYRLKPHEIEALKKMRSEQVRNVLVIGDLHEPFCLDEYLNFCYNTYVKYNCSQVIFIGDIIDNHYSSYHETNPDGLSGGDELDLAIKRIARWYKAFGDVGTKVIIGNHDRMVFRKGQTSNIPKKWIKSYKEVLEVPNWDFVERYVQDNVQYIHGEGGTARTKCRADMQNTIQGHLHTQCYTEHYVGQNYRVFGLQTGCGIDHESYAMAYAKYGKKPAIGVGLCLENGSIAFNVLMPL